MLNFIYSFAELGAGIANTDHLVEALLYYHEDVLINGRTQDAPFFLMIKIFEIGTATEETDPKWGLRDDQYAPFFLITAGIVVSRMYKSFQMVQFRM